MSFPHGLRSHPLYPIWGSMKQRCYNKLHKSYQYYGAKGISVCDEWRYNVKLFIEWCLANGWKKELQIDRIDNNKGYSPNNCQFLTPSENALKKDKREDNSSGYIGISFKSGYRFKNRWGAQLDYQTKRFNLGHFKTKELALQARNEFIIKNKLPHLIQQIIMEKN